MTTHVFKPDMPPPGNRIGIVAWARANLFSSWLNTLLTLFAFYLICDYRCTFLFTGIIV